MTSVLHVYHLLLWSRGGVVTGAVGTLGQKSIIDHENKKKLLRHLHSSSIQVLHDTCQVLHHRNHHHCLLVSTYCSNF